MIVDEMFWCCCLLILLLLVSSKLASGVALMLNIGAGTAWRIFGVDAATVDWTLWSIL